MTDENLTSEPVQSSAGPGPHPIRDRAVAVVGVLAAVAVAAAHRAEPAVAVAAAGMTLACIPLAITDLREHRLPNRIVGPLAGVVTVVVLAAAITGTAGGDIGRAVLAIELGLATAAGLLLLNLIGGLGMGDVKFGYPMATAVGWFGWQALAVTLLVTSAVGAVAAAVVLAVYRDRHRQLPYGPFLIIGMVAGLLSGA